MRHSKRLVALACVLLSACASKRGTDHEPTLATLSGREVPVSPDPGVTTSPEQAISAYRGFLEVAPSSPLRAEALRRLGDLEMDSTDNRLAAGQLATTDFRAAIKSKGAA